MFGHVLTPISQLFSGALLLCLFLSPALANESALERLRRQAREELEREKEDSKKALQGVELPRKAPPREHLNSEEGPFEISKTLGEMAALYRRVEASLHRRALEFVFDWQPEEDELEELLETQETSESFEEVFELLQQIEAELNQGQKTKLPLLKARLEMLERKFSRLEEEDSTNKDQAIDYSI